MQQWINCTDRKMFDEGDMLVINCFAGNDKEIGVPAQEAEFDLSENEGEQPRLDFYLNNVPVNIALGVMVLAGASTAYASRKDDETGNQYGVCLVQMGPDDNPRFQFIGVCGKDIDTAAGKMRVISALEEITTLIEPDAHIEEALKTAAELLTGSSAGGS